jgi:hypothetical protein
MNTVLLNLSGIDINDNPIVLDSYDGDSDAVYYAENDEAKVFYCCEPDRADEANRKKQKPEPRCDYLLVGRTDNTVRFIELKGADIRSGMKCCSNTWEHAFHQLLATFDACSISYEQQDIFELILSTSMPKGSGIGRSTSFTKYGRYKEIVECFGYPPKVLYNGDVDQV